MLKVTVFCADDDDAGQAIAGIDLYFDNDAIQANNSAGINAGKHSLSLGLVGEIVNGINWRSRSGLGGGAAHEQIQSFIASFVLLPYSSYGYIIYFSFSFSLTMKRLF